MKNNPSEEAKASHLEAEENAPQGTKIGSRYWMSIAASPMGQHLIQSASQGGVFSSLASGLTSVSHRQLIVRAILALQAAGKSQSEIEAELSNSCYNVGNSSAFRQWLDKHVQISDSGLKGSFKSWADYWGEGKAPRAAPSISMI